VDAIIAADDTVWTIEINTSPGMTDTSDLPAQAAAAGIGFGQLVRKYWKTGLPAGTNDDEFNKKKKTKNICTLQGQGL
jgi:D-alanine-D-alanine ligase